MLTFVFTLVELTQQILEAIGHALFADIIIEDVQHLPERLEGVSAEAAAGSSS